MATTPEGSINNGAAQRTWTEVEALNALREAGVYGLRPTPADPVNGRFGVLGASYLHPEIGLNEHDVPYAITDEGHRLDERVDGLEAIMPAPTREALAWYKVHILEPVVTIETGGFRNA